MISLFRLSLIIVIIGITLPSFSQTKSEFSDSIKPKISFRGYDKPLRSNKESIIVSNLSDSTIFGFGINFHYFDIKGRQIHGATHDFKKDIPPGESRIVYFPSWDKQQVWYYHKSMKPQGRVQATPFKVKADVIYIDYYED